jgi:hypothetical protein
MRKLLVLAVLLLALAYAAWPALAAWQLRTAVKSRDLPAIEQKVDWPTLRANLKRTIGDSLRDDSRAPDAGAISKAIKRTLGPMVTDRLIDFAVTPANLARVLAGRAMLRERKRDTAGEVEQDASASDPLAPRRLRWAFFESPTRFRIEVADRQDPAKRIVSVLELQGVAWKLVDVYYR